MILLISWLLVTVIIGGLIAMTARWLGPQILVGAFAGSLVLAIMIAGKLGVIPFFEDYSLSASVFVYSATFIFTDVLAEIYGKKAARNAVFSGLLLYPLLYLTINFAIEWEPHMLWAENQDAFATTMGTGLRIIIASICGFSASQLHDIWAFHFWKEKTNGKYLWLRNNASTMVSQLIDTVVFYTIAFYGIFPIFKIIIFTYIVKLIIAAIDTPVVYAVVSFIRAGEKNTVENSTTK